MLEKALKTRQAQSRVIHRRRVGNTDGGNNKEKQLYGFTALICLVAAAGCGPGNPNAGVSVSYKQVANFHEYRLASDSNDSHGAGDGMFIMYKVTQIKNTGSAAQAFVFDVNKVVTVTPDKTSNETVNDGNILLGGQNLTTVSVPAAQTKSVSGCFIKQALTANPQSLVLAQVPITYQIDPNQVVSMGNLAPAGSVASVSNALPNTLQSLCSGS